MVQQRWSSDSGSGLHLLDLWPPLLLNPAFSSSPPHTPLPLLHYGGGSQMGFNGCGCGGLGFIYSRPWLGMAFCLVGRRGSSASVQLDAWRASDGKGQAEAARRGSGALPLAGEKGELSSVAVCLASRGLGEKRRAPGFSRGRAHLQLR